MQRLNNGLNNVLSRSSSSVPHSPYVCVPHLYYCNIGAQIFFKYIICVGFIKLQDITTNNSVFFSRKSTDFKHRRGRWSSNIVQSLNTDNKPLLEHNVRARVYYIVRVRTHVVFQTNKISLFVENEIGTSSTRVSFSQITTIRPECRIIVLLLLFIPAVHSIIVGHGCWDDNVRPPVAQCGTNNYHYCRRRGRTIVERRRACYTAAEKKPATCFGGARGKANVATLSTVTPPRLLSGVSIPLLVAMFAKSKNQ